MSKIKEMTTSCCKSSKRRGILQEFEKNQLKKSLMIKAEALLSENLYKMRKRKVAKFQAMCDPTLPYELKIKALDQVIESDFESFDTQKISILRDIRLLRRILKKNEKVLAQRQI